MSKTYLKSDHFNGGGSEPAAVMNTGRLTSQTRLGGSDTSGLNHMSMPHPHRHHGAPDPTPHRSSFPAAETIRLCTPLFPAYHGRIAARSRARAVSPLRSPSRRSTG